MIIIVLLLNYGIIRAASKMTFLYQLRRNQYKPIAFKINE